MRVCSGEAATGSQLIPFDQFFDQLEQEQSKEKI
jgi:hypothetical protein